MALLLVLTPYIFVTATALAQTKPAQPGAGLPIGGGDLGTGDDLTQQAQQTNPTAQQYEQLPTTAITQAAEQNKDGVIANVEDMLKGSMGQYNDTYWGLSQFWSDDIVSNLFANIGQLIGKWITEFINGWVADTVQFLTAFLRIFVLNPNIPVNGLNGNGNDDISPYIRQAADTMYGIAVDLLLLLFVLCIWKYWAEGAWRGGGNLMGAVGRLIFTAGLLLAFPTIYAFEIQITNEMINAIYFNSADQVVMLDAAMAAAVKGGLLATASGLAHAFAPVIFATAGGAVGGGAGGMVLGTVGDIISFAGLIIYTILGVALITELVYILVLKAIQTALLVAQYMFAPIFIVFFATPDTESVCSGFFRSWVEVSLWTFVWVGLLKILVIILYSDFNPWGKIIMAVGVLQIMIQVPGFLARAQISPMSEFISAGLISGTMLTGFKSLAGAAQKRTAQLFDYMFNQQYAARGMSQSQETNLNGLPTQAADPQLLTQIRAAATGKGLPGQPGSGPPASKDGNAAHSLATPGLNTPGTPGQPETEEQKQARLLRERQMQAQQYAAVLANARAGGQLPMQGAQDGMGVGVGPGMGMRATPGIGNALAAGALIGTAAGVARALSDVGMTRGIADPTTAGMIRTQEGVMLPGSGPDLDGKFEHGEKASGVTNPADRYNHAGYKFVQMKIAAVQARKYDGNSIGYSDDGQTKLVGDGKGNLRHMRLRKGGSAEEAAHMVAAGGFTELFHDDSTAFDAARQSAIDAGEDAPKGMMERMGAGFMAYAGGTFKQTATAKQRFAKSLFKHAALGSEAYVSGKQGNAYTQYLTQRFGDWSAGDDTWATHILTDASSPASPWNPAYDPASEALFASGIPVTEINRAASANPYVMRLPAWQRKTAIPAVARYAEAIADSQYPGASDPVKNAAVGRIAGMFTNSEVEAAYSIEVESGGQDVTVPIVQTVAQLSEDPRCKDAASAYLNLRSLVAQGAGGGGARRARGGVVSITAMLTERGSVQAPPIDPRNIPMPGNVSHGAPVVEQDVDVQIVPNGSSGGGTNMPVQNLTTEISGGGGGGNPQIYTNTRVLGGVGGAGGDNISQQNVDVEVRASGDNNGTAYFSQGDIDGAMARASFNSRPLYQAAMMMVDMYNAGFNDTQIQDARLANVANHFYNNSQPHMLNTVAVAARVLGPSDVSAGTVQTIQTMIDAGHSPHDIQRPDVWTAEACLAQNIYPTPQTIRRYRTDDNFVPFKGATLPPNRPSNDEGHGYGGGGYGGGGGGRGRR